MLDEIGEAVENIEKKVRDYIAYEKKREEEKAASKQGEEPEKKAFSVVPAKLKGFLEVKGSTPGALEVVKNEEAINREIWGKGLYAIGTHSKMSAAEANRLFKLREPVEKNFDIIKALPGTDRVRDESAVLGRMFVAFISAIIYTELANALEEVAKER
ncbi:MAG: hypothetical protein IJ088_13205 [Clostridia bacterium]|nr:hypothetical protein [Clostridia bacterium]